MRGKKEERERKGAVSMIARQRKEAAERRRGILFRIESCGTIILCNNSFR